jgi:hypothetical protein
MENSKSEIRNSKPDLQAAAREHSRASRAKYFEFLISNFEFSPHAALV